jgi:hypothetical protein
MVVRHLKSLRNSALQNLKVRDKLVDLDEEGKITLKCVSDKHCWDVD